VLVQDRKVLTDFDVVAQAGSVKHAIRKEFHGVLVGDSLKIDLVPKSGRTVLCGVEVVAEKE
jgi:hypothetical protein